MNNGSRPTFRFQNLGPIKEAELELGDLTIIAGRNNTGKTYVAYALYGFLTQWHYGSTIHKPRQGLFRSAFELAMEAEESGHLKLPADKKALQILRTEYIDWTARTYSERGLRDVFSADAEAFKNVSFEVVLGDPPDLDTKQFEDSWLSLNQEGDEWILSPKVAHPQGGSYIFDLAHSYLEIMFPEMPINRNLFILTSERFGISLFHRELDFARSELMGKLRQMASDESMKGSESRSDLIDKASSRYARPIHDNINYTRDIPDLADQKSGLYEQKRHDDIKRMMDGYYRVESGGVRFVSPETDDGQFNLPLYRASSSARGLSDMYFYMRHVAKPGQLLMVDEPEAHLDTANQVEMARLLARLARSGVKVLVTTHSDYIVKEINNLIMLSQPFQNKEAVRKRLKYGEDDYLHPDQVRAYIADKGKLRRCKTNPYGIEYRNFDTTIDDINKASNELSERVWEEQEE